MMSKIVSYLIFYKIILFRLMKILIKENPIVFIKKLSKKITQDHHNLNQEDEIYDNLKIMKNINKKNINKNELVSIIIPTRDKKYILKRCIESIIKKSSYKNYEIIIINNNSKNKTTNYINSLKRKNI